MIELGATMSVRLDFRNMSSPDSKLGKGVGARLFVEIPRESPKFRFRGD